MYSFHSILECCNLFSGVKLSIRSFCFIFMQSVGTILLLLCLKVSSHSRKSKFQVLLLYTLMTKTFDLLD